MFVISRKRISLILIALILGIFAYCYEATLLNLEETRETTAVPSSGKVIVIDAGHGKPDERSTIKFWDYRSRN